MAKSWDGSEQGGGGGVNTIAVMQDEKIAINGDISGTQTSDDFGAFWKGGRGRVTPDRSDGAESPCMEADENPNFPNRVWKGNTYGLWVSNDSGIHWRLVDGTPSFHQGSTTRPRATGHQIVSDGAGNLYMIDNSGEVFRYFNYGGDGLGGTMVKIATLLGTGEVLQIDPNSITVLYAGIRGSAGNSLYRLTGIRTAAVNGATVGAYTNALAETRDIAAIAEGGITTLYCAHMTFGIRRYVASSLGSTATQILSGSAVITDNWCAVDGYRSGGATVLAVGCHGASADTASGNRKSIFLSSNAHAGTPTWVCLTLDDANMKLINKMGSDSAPPWWGYSPQGANPNRVKSGNALVKVATYSPEQLRFSRDHSKLYTVGTQGMWRFDLGPKRLYPCMRRHGVTTNNDLADIDRSVTPNRAWMLNNDFANMFTVDDDLNWTNNEWVPVNFTKNGGTCLFFDQSVSPHRVFMAYGDQDTNFGTLVWNANPYSNQANTPWTEIPYVGGGISGGRAYAGACRSVSGNLVVILGVAGTGIIRRVFTSFNPPTGGSWSIVEPGAFASISSGPGTVRNGRMCWVGATTNGVIYAYDRFTGIWRSTDAGVTWSKIVDVDSSTPRRGHLAVNPDNIEQFLFSDGVGPDAGLYFVDGAAAGTIIGPTRIFPDGILANALNGVDWVSATKPGAGAYILTEGSAGTALVDYQGPKCYHSLTPDVDSSYTELGDQSELDRVLKKASGLKVSDAGVVYISTFGPGAVTYRDRAEDTTPVDAVGITELIDFQAAPGLGTGNLVFTDVTPGTGESAVNATSLEIPSMTYETGNVYLLCLLLYDAAGAVEVPDSSGGTNPTVDSPNTTWTKITHFSATNNAIAVYRFKPSSNVTEPVTVGPFAFQHEGFQWHVIKVAGADLSGTNGSGAIGAFEEGNASSVTGTLTVPGYVPAALHARLDFFATNVAFDTFIVEGTKLREYGGGGDPPRSSVTAYEIGDDAAGTVGWDSGLSQAWRGIVVEVIPGTGTGAQDIDTGSSLVPEANKIVYAFVGNVESDGLASIPSSIEGFGLTWTQHSSTTTLDEASGEQGRVTVYRALTGASPTSAAFKAHFSGQNQKAVFISVMELDLAKLTGTAGADSKAQDAFATWGGSLSTPQVILPSSISESGASSGLGVTLAPRDPALWTDVNAGFLEDADQATVGWSMYISSKEALEAGDSLYRLSGATARWLTYYIEFQAAAALSTPVERFAVSALLGDEQTSFFSISATLGGFSTTLLTSGGASNDDNLPTASISPSANDLISIFVVSYSTLEEPNEPSVTGLSLDWIVRETEVYTDPGANEKRRVTLLTARPGGTPGTGALTIDFGGQNQNDLQWVVAQHNGAAGLRQLLKSVISGNINTLHLQPFNGGSSVLWLAKTGHEVFELDGEPPGWSQIAALYNGLSPGGATAAVHFLAGQDQDPTVQIAASRRQVMFAAELAEVESPTETFFLSAIIGSTQVSGPTEVIPTPRTIPKVTWEVGGRTIEAVDWRCNDVCQDFGEAQGGYDQAWLKIDKDTYESAYPVLMQGSRIHGETDEGEIVWQGRVAAPVQSMGDGTYEITGEGLQHEARRETRRLLIQSRDYSQWIEMDSEELGYNVSSKLSMKNTGGKLVLGRQKEDVILSGSHVGFVFFAEDNKITHVAFDFERTYSMPNHELVVREAETEGGITTEVRVWGLGSPDIGLTEVNLTAKPNSPLVAIIFRTIADLTNTSNERVILTNVRVSGLAGARTSIDPSELAEIIAKELHWSVYDTVRAGFNGLPLDIIDGDWGGEGFDYLALLCNYVWRMDFNGLTFRPWGEETWYVRRAYGATENLQVLPFYNRVRIKFSRPSGRTGELVRHADPDPLKETGIINEFTFELTDDQPNKDLAAEVSSRILEQTTSLRYAGQVDTSIAYRGDGSGNVLAIRAGSHLVIEDWGDEDFQGKHRIHEIEKRPDGVTIGINEEVSVARKLARRQLKRANRGSGRRRRR